MQNCKDCITYAMCRSRLLEYLKSNYTKPYDNTEIFRAYFYAIKYNCNAINEKYQTTRSNPYVFNPNELIYVLINELSVEEINGIAQ